MKQVYKDEIIKKSNNESEKFTIQCPVCKMGHILNVVKKGHSVKFACSDLNNTDKVGCKSIITISVAEEGYNDKNKPNGK